MKQFSIVTILLLLSFSAIHAQDTSTIRPKQNHNDSPGFRIALQGGWSYRIGKIADNIPADLRKYNKGLKSGFHAGVDAGYIFSDGWGFGLRYSYFHTGNELANVTVTTRSGETKTGTLKDDINVHYIGPVFYMRYASPNSKLAFQLGVSAGYVRYIDNAMVVDKLTLTANNWAFNPDLGMEYMITRHFGVSASFALFVTELSKYTLDDGNRKQEIKLEKDQKEDLSRLDLSAGIKWRW